MIYRVSTKSVAAIALFLVLGAAWWLAWSRTLSEVWTVGLAAVTVVSFALMTMPYEMELADGRVELRSLLSSRSLQLKDVREVTLHRFRGKKAIGLLTKSELFYVPTYMPGLVPLIEAIQASNPEASIDPQVMPRGPKGRRTTRGT